MGFFRGLLKIGGAVASAAGFPIAGAIASGVGSLLQSSQDASNVNSAQTAANQQNIDLANTSVQRRVVDLKAAGLNPMLAYGSSASSPQIVSSEPSSIEARNSTQANAAQIDNLRSSTLANSASAAKSIAEADAIKYNLNSQNKGSSTAKSAAETDNTKGLTFQQGLINARITAEIQKTWTEVNLTAAQVTNIKAELPNILERLSQIIAQTHESNSATSVNSLKSKLLSAALPQAVNLSEAQKSWWMRTVSPYLPDFMKSVSVGSQLAK